MRQSPDGKRPGSKQVDDTLELEDDLLEQVRRICMNRHRHELVR